MHHSLLDVCFYNFHHESVGWNYNYGKLLHKIKLEENRINLYSNSKNSFSVNLALLI